MKAKELPSLEFLNECFEIDCASKTGLRWKNRPRHHFEKERGMNYFNSKFADTPAGFLDTNGYYCVGLKIGNCESLFRVHRIIYFLFFKEQLHDQLVIDHIDRNPRNNKIENLRLVTHIENMANRTKHKNNTSGYTGIRQKVTKKGIKWQANIRIKDKLYNLGYFWNIEDALKTREIVKKEVLSLFYKGFSEEEIKENTVYLGYCRLNKDGSPSKAWLKKQNI